MQDGRLLADYHVPPVGGRAGLVGGLEGQPPAEMVRGAARMLRGSTDTSRGACGVVGVGSRQWAWGASLCSTRVGGASPASLPLLPGTPLSPRCHLPSCPHLPCLLALLPLAGLQVPDCDRACQAGAGKARPRLRLLELSLLQLSRQLSWRGSGAPLEAPPRRHCPEGLCGSQPAAARRQRLGLHATAAAAFAAARDAAAAAGSCRHSHYFCSGPAAQHSSWAAPLSMLLHYPSLVCKQVWPLRHGGNCEHDSHPGLMTKRRKCHYLVPVYQWFGLRFRWLGNTHCASAGIALPSPWRPPLSGGSAIRAAADPPTSASPAFCRRSSHTQRCHSWGCAAVRSMA